MYPSLRLVLVAFDALRTLLFEVKLSLHKHDVGVYFPTLETERSIQSSDDV